MSFGLICHQTVEHLCLVIFVDSDKEVAVRNAVCHGIDRNKQGFIVKIDYFLKIFNVNF